MTVVLSQPGLDVPYNCFLLRFRVSALASLGPVRARIRPSTPISPPLLHLWPHSRKIKGETKPQLSSSRYPNSCALLNLMSRIKIGNKVEFPSTTIFYR